MIDCLYYFYKTYQYLHALFFFFNNIFYKKSNYTYAYIHMNMLFSYKTYNFFHKFYLNFFFCINIKNNLRIDKELNFYFHNTNSLFDFLDKINIEVIYSLLFIYMYKPFACIDYQIYPYV